MSRSSALRRATRSGHASLASAFAHMRGSCILAVGGSIVKRMRVLLGLVALLVMCFAACNQTVGDCYPVGQGAGAGDIGAGSGAVVSVGSSGAGE